ncbi:hypothetical protein H8356DRAFT_1323745 [Neocallimastix lanati (nom. inval.)]|nr:hypothetical protein H8356DRAFT_1323745 [Neocallimastix sp. JGI-2020a]
MVFKLKKLFFDSEEELGDYKEKFSETGPSRLFEIENDDFKLYLDNLNSTTIKKKKKESIKKSRNQRSISQHEKTKLTEFEMGNFHIISIKETNSNEYYQYCHKNGKRTSLSRKDNFNNSSITPRNIKNHGLLMMEQESTYPKNINKKILSNIEENIQKKVYTTEEYKIDINANLDKKIYVYLPIDDKNFNCGKSGFFQKVLSMDLNKLEDNERNREITKVISKININTKFSDNPTRADLNACIQILNNLKTYCGADFAGDEVERRSISGYIFVLGTLYSSLIKYIKYKYVQDEIIKNEIKLTVIGFNSMMIDQSLNYFADFIMDMQKIPIYKYFADFIMDM